MTLIAVVVAGGAPMVVALLILRRRPRHPVGWLLLAHAASVAVAFGVPSGAGRVWDQLSAGAWVALFLWLVLICYLLPSGHLPSRWWRWWVGTGLAGTALFVVGAAGDAQAFRDAHGGQPPPVPWLPEPVSDAVGWTGFALVVLLVFGVVPAVALRLRRARGDDRRALLWLVWGALSVPLALGLNWFGYFALDRSYALAPVSMVVVGVALPVTIGIAMLRARLFDIELVLSRTLVHAALVAVVTCAYAGVLRGADAVTGSGRAAGVLAVGLVAVAVHPLHLLLSRWIERWVFGYRSEPHAAIRLLAARADVADPGGLTATITSAVADALRVERVWVEDVDRAVPGGRVERTLLEHRGSVLGNLAVEVPAARQLSKADLALLRDLARYAAVIVRADQLTTELTSSRSRLVSAREEERRRLRRDLHDGLGPSLAAIVLKLNAAQSRDDAAARNELLTETRGEARAAIGEVRRLVDGLRPAAIDQVGLLDAIRQRAAAVTGPDLTVEVTGPAPFPPLPAAVEVAAFRIAAEAITNAARHSAASRCHVDIAVEEVLVLTVTDDGVGLSAPSSTGVGSSSMAERAAELGGTCTISTRRAGGVEVVAVIPLREPTAPEALAEDAEAALPRAARLEAAR